MPGLLIWLTNCYGCSVVDSPSQVKKRDYMNAHRGWSASGASKIFGTVLAALRSIQGVSQRDLADLSGGSVSFSHLRALESGERWPTDKTLINLAAQLGAREISPAFLIQARDKLESLVPRMQRAPGDTEDEMSTAEAICDWLVEVATPAPFDVVRSRGLHQFATVTWVASEHESRTFEVIRVGPSSGWRVVLGGCPPNVPQGTPRRNSEPLELPTSPRKPQPCALLGTTRPRGCSLWPISLKISTWLSLTHKPLSMPRCLRATFWRYPVTRSRAT